MRYDVYKVAGWNPREEVPVFHLWQGDVRLDELFRQFGFVVVKDKLRDLRHLEGIFLTPELYLIPTGKKPNHKSGKVWGSLDKSEEPSKCGIF